MLSVATTRHILRSFIKRSGELLLSVKLHSSSWYFFSSNISYFCRLQSYNTRPTTYTSWNRRRRDFCRKTVSWSGWWASKRASCWARPACTRNAKSTTPPVRTWLGVWNAGGEGSRTRYFVGRFWLVVMRRWEMVIAARQGGSTCRLLRLYFYILLFSAAPFKLCIILLPSYRCCTHALTPRYYTLQCVCDRTCRFLHGKNGIIPFVACIESRLLLLYIILYTCEKERECEREVDRSRDGDHYNQREPGVFIVILFYVFYPEFYCVFLVFCRFILFNILYMTMGYRFAASAVYRYYRYCASVRNGCNVYSIHLTNEKTIMET